MGEALNKEPRVLIVADNASERMGGEAILPLHYFRFLRRRGVFVKLLTHERVLDELRETLDEETLRDVWSVPDTRLQKLAFAMGKILPQRVAQVLTETAIMFSTGARQSRLARQIVSKYDLNIVHQPIPVSPNRPSFMYDLGASVIIGPMNGGMRFPPAFKAIASFSERFAMRMARLLGPLMNFFIPGKRRASLLLVANIRTQDALPGNVKTPSRLLVENGVDLERWITLNRREETEDNSPVQFTYLGRLVDWKGVDYLLHALKRVTAEQNVILNIIGEGPEEKSLKRLVGKLDLQAQVRFLGFKKQAECVNYIQDSYALVLPSLFECGGAVVLESMASGTPVIATNWGGPAEYITEECGFLVDPVSSDSLVGGLSEAMLRFAVEPELSKRMGERGRARVETHFSWDAKIDAIIEIYRSVLADPGR